MTFIYLKGNILKILELEVFTFLTNKNEVKNELNQEIL